MDDRHLGMPVADDALTTPSALRTLITRRRAAGPATVDDQYDRGRPDCPVQLRARGSDHQGRGVDVVRLRLRRPDPAQHAQRTPVGFQKSVTVAEQQLYPTRSYSLIKHQELDGV